MYAVLQLHQKATIEVQGVPGQLDRVQQIELSWIDGQTGAIPVFDNYEDAKKYAVSESRILELGFVEGK